MEVLVSSNLTSHDPTALLATSRQYLLLCLVTSPSTHSVTYSLTGTPARLRTPVVSEAFGTFLVHAQASVAHVPISSLQIPGGTYSAQRSSFRVKKVVSWWSVFIIGVAVGASYSCSIVFPALFASALVFLHLNALRLLSPFNLSRHDENHLCCDWLALPIFVYLFIPTEARWSREFVRHPNHFFKQVVQKSKNDWFACSNTPSRKWWVQFVRLFIHAESHPK